MGRVSDFTENRSPDVEEQAIQNVVLEQILSQPRCPSANAKATLAFSWDPPSTPPTPSGLSPLLPVSSATACWRACQFRSE